MNWLINLFVGKLKEYVVVNWKTTAIGAISWVLAHYVAPRFNIGNEMQQMIMQYVTNFLMPIALFSKDADKTGTIAQPRTDPAVVAAQNAAAAGGGTTFVFTPIADADRPPG